MATGSAGNVTPESSNTAATNPFLPCRRLPPGQHRLKCGHRVVALDDQNDQSICATNCVMTVFCSRLQFLCTECLENCFYCALFDKARENEQVLRKSEETVREEYNAHLSVVRSILCSENGFYLDTKKAEEVDKKEEVLSRAFCKMELKDNFEDDLKNNLAAVFRLMNLM
ncbi:hypothetical protein NA57DRAFT_51340 [Rhizodiscina lignyota]|uniref:Uncharacterized protein n=1 Tax=Rhizodiscina lignyota TaxID=1504668 RepID=A0A9P4INT3_9PEZI|nr:hypothetical protein NA57DRAFT_51340 [Rhizodiscina lignyota]